MFWALPSLLEMVETLSSHSRPSNTMVIYSLAENFRRVRRLMSRAIASDFSNAIFMTPLIRFQPSKSLSWLKLPGGPHFSDAVHLLMSMKRGTDRSWTGGKRSNEGRFK